MAFGHVYSLAVSSSYMWSSNEIRHLIVFETMLPVASEAELDNSSAISCFCETVLQTVPSA